jgi:hypothetical protein
MAMMAATRISGAYGDCEHQYREQDPMHVQITAARAN